MTSDVARAQGTAPSNAEAALRAGGPVGEMLLRVDWASTPVGPLGAWPDSLTSYVSAVLRSRFSMWMAWGQELTFFCNDAYRRDTLGRKYPWALGRPAREVWAEIWGEIGPRIDAVMSTGRSTWDEALMLFLQRSGYREETYHTFSYSPLTDEGGAIAGMLCVVREDTERAIAARRMETLRDLGSEPTVVRNTKEALEVAARHLGGNDRDLPFTLLYALDPGSASAQLMATSGIRGGHPAAPERLGGGREQPVWPLDAVASGQTVVVDDLAARWRDLPTGAWEDPPTHALVLPLTQQGAHGPAGFLVAGLNRHRPLDDGYRAFVGLVAGQVAAALGAARAYEEERERAEQLAELDRAKTAFFTNVSHEFRTPLTLMLGPADDALADEQHPLEHRQRERVEVMRRNALRLLKLVNTLLDFSSIGSGKLQASFEPVDLGRYTAELAGAFSDATERVGLALVIDCPPLPQPVWVDADSWAKIVLNLLSNALKFTPDGRITVRLRAAGAMAELSVADTGIGIAPEEQGALFERFYRATATGARSHEGSGIGLALVAELAELHGGQVSVDSALGQGSTFTVRVPLDRPEAAPGEAPPPAAADAGDPPAVFADRGGASRRIEGFVAEAMRWLDSSAPAPSATDDALGGDRPRILVIDDNADMLAYIADVLAQDYAVITASNGATGVELARADPPDLVLSDVMLPGLDGFGVLAALRADEATALVPVVLLSARAGEESTVEGLDAGADDYLTKPFSVRELRARVRSNLELDRVRRVRARLERNQVLLDQAQRLARVGSWEIDADSGTMTLTDELRRQLHLEGDEPGPLGLDWVLANRVHPDDVATVRAEVAAAFEGKAIDYHLRFVQPDGTTRVFRAIGEVEKDRDGRPLRLRGSNQDITDQLVAEQALAAAAAEREAAAREHRIADELQRSLLPAPAFAPDNIAIATFYRPGAEGTQVGGDWFDVIELGAGRTALVIGDVMGRGVKAAAVMGQLRASVRAYARLDLPPADVLELLDATVRELGEEHIVTCVYAVYDPYDHSLAYANAGHLPPLILPPGKPPERLRAAAGPPLGSGPVTLPAARVVLPAGTVIALYTDGLVERRQRDLDDGIDAFAAALAEVEDPSAALAGIVDSLLPDGGDDDVAVLLGRTRLDGGATTSVLLHVQRDEDAIHPVRAFVRERLEAWKVPAPTVDDAILVASELVTNAIIHGLPPVELRVRRTDARLVLEVIDGASYLPRRLRPSPEDEHGRGLQIVSHLAERWGIRPVPGGKTLWCELAVASAPQG
jgi:signal transduction histidine kinase/DNA-binding response OmpR family regulator/anti-sigma regulatory factor (Ser/Thr protein kinase)